MMNDHISQFNVRVYGLWLKDNSVLISKEKFKDRSLVKFPGGGLQFGEGIKDCLKREFKEEIDIEISVGDLFYVTDNFIQSAFRKQDQIISIYYKITSKEVVPPQTNEHEFEWVQWNQQNETKPKFTFAQDAKVFQLLQAL